MLENTLFLVPCTHSMEATYCIHAATTSGCMTMTHTHIPLATSSLFQANPPAARILVADDDPFIRQMLEAMLLSAGYNVLCAPDGAALVQMAQEHIPDLLLIDLMMPHLDGFEAIRQLRHDTRTGHLPMIVVTARSRTDDLVQGF